MSPLLDLGRRLQALAQTGLHYTEGGVFDRQRYTDLQALAAELLALGTQTPAEKLVATFRADDGYATPKIDVRGACFQGDRVLLVRERGDGGWTLPGGWADVQDSPAHAVEKEIEQESGFTARAVKLAALYDRNKHPHPDYLFHVWKAFFVCEITGGSARESEETDAVEWFSVGQLPELSTPRVTGGQIRRMYEHHCDRGLAADFD